MSSVVPEHRHATQRNAKQEHGKAWRAVYGRAGSPQSQSARHPHAQWPLRRRLWMEREDGTKTASKFTLVRHAGTYQPRQERFCVLYFGGKSATNAYREAYGNVRTARAAASRLLTSVNIQTRLSELGRAMVLDAVISRQRMLEFLTRIVMTPLADIDERHELCAKATYSNGRLKHLRIVDKMRAIELLARMQGWFAEHQKPDPAPDNGMGQLLAAIRRGE